MTGARRKALAGWGLVLIVAASVASACSDSKADGKPIAKSSTSSTRSTTTVDSRGTAALQAWETYVKASAEWTNPPNPGDARLRELVAASALADYQLKLAADLSKGVATRPGPNGVPQHVTTVESVSSTTATLRDCFVDDFVSYNVSTGAILDSGISTRDLRVALTFEGGKWKIAKIDQLKATDGRRSCGASS